MNTENQYLTVESLPWGLVFEGKRRRRRSAAVGRPRPRELSPQEHYAPTVIGPALCGGLVIMIVAFRPTTL